MSGETHVLREWLTAGSKRRWRTSCWHRAPDEVIGALDALAARLQAAEEGERSTQYEADHYRARLREVEFSLREAEEALREIERGTHNAGNWINELARAYFAAQEDVT